MPHTTGVLETSLYVEDIPRAREFYHGVFGFEVFFADRRMCAMGVPGAQVLLLFRRGATLEPAPAGGGFIPPHNGEGPLHVCFAIPLGELAAWETHLRALEIEVESRLRWSKGGVSLYFRDRTTTRWRSRRLVFGRITESVAKPSGSVVNCAQ